MEDTMPEFRNYMFEKLAPHIDHHIECVFYGDHNDPADICIECWDCDVTVISAEDYDFEEE